MQYSYKLFGKGKLSKEGIATICNVPILNMTTLVNCKPKAKCCLNCYCAFFPNGSHPCDFFDSGSYTSLSVSDHHAISNFTLCNYNFNG